MIQFAAVEKLFVGEPKDLRDFLLKPVQIRNFLGRQGGAGPQGQTSLSEARRKPVLVLLLSAKPITLTRQPMFAPSVICEYAKCLPRKAGKRVLFRDFITGC